MQHVEDKMNFSCCPLWPFYPTSILQLASLIFYLILGIRTKILIIAYKDHYDLPSGYHSSFNSYHWTLQFLASFHLLEYTVSFIQETFARSVSAAKSALTPHPLYLHLLLFNLSILVETSRSGVYLPSTPMTTSLCHYIFPYHCVSFFSALISAF